MRRRGVHVLMAIMLVLPFAVGNIFHAEKKVVSVGGAVLLNCDKALFKISASKMKSLKMNYKCFECSSSQELAYVDNIDKGDAELRIQTAGSKFNIFSNENHGIHVVILDMQIVDGGMFQCVLTLREVDDGARTLEHFTLLEVQDPAVAPIEHRIGYETPLIAAVGIASMLLTLLISYGIVKFVQALINRMESDEAQLINHLVKTRFFRCVCSPVKQISAKLGKEILTVL